MKQCFNRNIVKPLPLLPSLTPPSRTSSCTFARHLLNPPPPSPLLSLASKEKSKWYCHNCEILPLMFTVSLARFFAFPIHLSITTDCTCPGDEEKPIRCTLALVSTLEIVLFFACAPEFDDGEEARPSKKREAHADISSRDTHNKTIVRLCIEWRRNWSVSRNDESYSSPSK